MCDHSNKSDDPMDSAWYASHNIYQMVSLYYYISLYTVVQKFLKGILNPQNNVFMSCERFSFNYALEYFPLQISRGY